MARWSGGPITHRALTGPMAAREPDEAAWRREILYTLGCIQDIRTRLENNEMATVRQAREAGFSWTEIATRLGQSRQAVWERWREVDDVLPGAAADG